MFLCWVVHCLFMYPNSGTSHTLSSTLHKVSNTPLAQSIMRSKCQAELTFSSSSSLAQRGLGNTAGVRRRQKTFKKQHQEARTDHLNSLLDSPALELNPLPRLSTEICFHRPGSGINDRIRENKARSVLKESAKSTPLPQGQDE